MPTLSSNYTGLKFRGTEQVQPNKAQTVVSQPKTDNPKGMSNKMKAGIGVGTLAVTASVIAGLAIRNKNVAKNAKNVIQNASSKGAQGAKGETATSALNFSGLKENIKSMLLDADASLFPNATMQPKLSLDKITPESLVLVHMTDHFPKGGVIKSVKEALKNNDGTNQYRSTVHFALNKSVTEHVGGNSWNTMKYAVLMPFKSTVEQTPSKNIIGGVTDDFFFMNEVKLPEGSVILKFNDKIPQGKLQVSQAVDDGQVLKGVSLVETSNPQTGDVATLLTKKMGYTSMEDVAKDALGVNDSDYKIITSDLTKLNDEERNRYCELSVDVGEKAMEYAQKVNTSWGDFAKENNYHKGLHAYSPWGRSEHVIQGVNLLGEGGNNSWLGKDYVGNAVDYKQEFIKVLDESMQALPKDKELSFDANKLKIILSESNTPKDAEKSIKEKMGLKILPNKGEMPQSISDVEIYTHLDTVIGLSDIQKEMMKRQSL